MLGTECVDCTVDWVTRGHCGPWEKWQIVLYITANFMTFAAYVSLFLFLSYATAKDARRASFDFKHLQVEDVIILRRLFGSFILVCGIGHLEGVISFVWAYYPLFMAWHVLVAWVSWFAVLGTLRYRAKLLVGI